MMSGLGGSEERSPSSSSSLLLLLLLPEGELLRSSGEGEGDTGLIGERGAGRVSEPVKNWLLG